MSNLINSYHPDWLKDTKGHFAALWENCYDPQCNQIIRVACYLNDLQSGITPCSSEIFGVKVKEILSAKNERQFVQCLGELATGAALSVQCPKVKLEPLDRPYNKKNNKRPVSPDFSINVEGNEIFIDSTTIHSKLFDDWYRVIDDLKVRVGKRLSKRNINRCVYIDTPIGLSTDSLTNKEINELVTLISRSRQGSTDLALGTKFAQVKWKTPRHVNMALDEQNPIPALSKLPKLTKGEFATFGGMGSESAVRAHSFSVTPKFDDNSNSQLFKSIVNSLVDKHRQLIGGNLNVLSIQVDMGLVRPESVTNLISKRVWPNKNFSWISGIEVLILPKSFGPETYTCMHMFTDNPNADMKLSASAKRVFTVKKVPIQQ